jgi:hypothetical protein
MRWRGRRTIALTTFAIASVAAAQMASAATTADEPKPTTPTGLGDLLPTPDLTRGDQKTIFEHYSPAAYILDYDLGWKDTIDAIFARNAEHLMTYIVSVVRGSIAIGWYLFSFAKVDSISAATTEIMSASSGALIAWMLPSALMIGAVVAYMRRRAEGSAMSQLVWVFAAGVVSVSLALSPGLWVRSVDDARSLGATTVMDSTSAAVTGDNSVPFEWREKPTFQGPTGEGLLRKSADATWRAFALTPWCIAEFGSLEACKRYGQGMLDRQTDRDARRDYIKDEIAKAEGGEDAATVRWTQGKESTGRIGVLVFAAIAATLFALLTVALAVTALMAFIGCLLLLTVGVFFSCLWVIPGKPRQWGMNWFEALLGMLIQSILAMLVFGTTLALVTAIFSVTGQLGWLPACGLVVAVLVAAFRLRRVLNSLISLMRPGTGSMLVGRGFRNIARMLVSSAVARAAGPRAGYIAGQAIPGADGAPSYHTRSGATTQRRRFQQFRTAPTAGGGGGNGAGATARGGNPPPEPHPGGGGGTLAVVNGRVTGRDALPASGVSGSPNGQGRQEAGRGRRLAQAGSRGDGQRTFVVTTAGEVRRSRTSGSRDRSESSARPTAQRRRQTRQGPVSAPDGRFEPRRHAHSASLRDGPPKSTGSARRTARRPRTYRQYNRVVKDGVTLYVPTKR